ncbi:hypothetical protein [Methanosphaerula palustris]|nr:hypothetical protein [Methanosphaerula palustris]
MMKFQTITVILIFLLIGVASGSLVVAVSAGVPLSSNAQAESSTTVQTTPATSLDSTASLASTASLSTTVPTVLTTTQTTVQGGHSTGTLSWAGTGYYASDLFTLSPGLAKLSVTGDQITGVYVKDSTGQTIGSTSAGPQPGSSSITIPTAGSYLIDVISSGTWTASVSMISTQTLTPITTILTTIPTTTLTTISTSIPTSIPTIIPTTNITTLPTTIPTTIPTVFITNVTFLTPTVETLNPNYTPATYPIDTSTSRTPDIDTGMPAYDGPVPTPTTVVQTVTPTNSSTSGIVVPVNTSVDVPVRTVERLENISNASPYQTYTPAPTPAPAKGPDYLKILLLVVLAIVGGGGIALLSRYYRGRQQALGEVVPGTEDGGAIPVVKDGTDAVGEAAPEGQILLDQIADYDPATSEIENLMQMLNKLVQNSQKSLHNPSIRLDDLIRLSGISTLQIPERVAQWGADHGYVVVSRDFKNEALLFRQLPVPGEPDLGIMYIGDLIRDNEIPPAPSKPGLSEDVPDSR